MRNPELVQWKRDGIQRSNRANRAIVFVHGIFSNHSTFQTFYNRLGSDSRFGDFDIFYFDYDYNGSLESNGEALANRLTSIFAPTDRIEIIAHSMGGLVARLAVLSRRMEFVRSIFLLGTPNVGAIRTAQIALLAQLIHSTLNVTFAVFPRKRGIVDLTCAAEILRRHGDHPEHTAHIDYVTIPGLFYHEARSYWNLGGDLWRKLFAILRLGLGFLQFVVPLFAIRLSTPHDGIVEEVSNNLIPSTAGRKSEKNDSINMSDITRITYAHIETDSSENLTHVELQSDKQIYETVTEIILTFSSEITPDSLESRLVNWYRGLTSEDSHRITRVRFRD